MMKTQLMTEQGRSFETSLDIDASPEEVWRALTEAEELVRWFPLRAEVTPGIGGSMRWAWEESWDWRTRIDAWEPGRRLRLVQDEYQPAEDAERANVAMEFTLETHAGKTRVRLVHSGFGRGAAWDNELDSISEGWPAELQSLRLYLERHRGRTRYAGKATVDAPMPPEAVWAKVTGPGGYVVKPTTLTKGGPFEVITPGGDRLTGIVEAWLPQRSLTGIVPALDDALLRIATYRSASGDGGVWLWLASYTDAGRAQAFEREAKAALKKLFA
jgi:uncharacterized protein YndB with AHSA1/START domain